MSRTAFVNGRYQILSRARVHIEDRGYQFADGVYDVCEVRGGVPIDEDRHLARLRRSLGELAIRPPMADAPLRLVLREVIRRNRIDDGLLYLQVTRGVAPRGHAFPSPPVAPSLVVTARRLDPMVRARATAGIAVITVPETRWARVDIKTISLLPNVLAKQAAKDAGAGEAWFVGKDGLVSEGASSNAWIVTAEGALVTAPTTAAILRGVTREAVFDTAAELGLRFEERQFSVAEARGAREAFITAATALVTPVIRLDGQPVGSGQPGPTVLALRAALIAHTTPRSPAGVARRSALR